MTSKEEQNGIERREDIGTKISAIILVAIINLLVGAFLWRTYDMAIAANNMSNKNSLDIAVLQENHHELIDKIDEINKKLGIIIQMKVK